MKFKDYYEIFGLARTATPEEIKRTYRKLARKYHPDINKEADAEARFKELGEAYAVLKDPEKRATYDRMGSGWKAGQDFHPPPGWDNGFEFSGRDFGNAPGNDSGQPDDHASSARERDFFESLFGQARRSGQSSAGPQQGEDRHARVSIDLADAYHGARRTISLRMPVLDAAGQVTMQARQLAVSIPKGVRAGQHLRLNGQGGISPGVGPPGDLYLEIVFNADPQFRPDGRDVYLHLPLTPWEAALGASIAVPTPEGPVQLTIPPDSLAGRQLRMKGRGIPGTSGQAAGDLYAVLTIALPPADTERARDAYREMAKSFDFNPRRVPEPTVKETTP